ncbi:MAG: hypothetical protein HY063_14110 [Bacteroidetes bacterium]|nr:hypothetical protein [Bacteroidota bacterium]
MKIKTKIIFILLGITLACCTTPLLVPNENDVSRAQTKWSGSDLASLQKGHSLYMNKCGSCHYLHRPNKYSEEKWKKEMPEMSNRAKLTGEEQELVLHYLLTMREANRN